MRRSLPILLALGVILGAGVAQGVWIHRWGSPFDYDKMTDTLRAIPTTIGDWEGVDQTIDAPSLEVGRIQTYLSRIYTNQITRESVGVLLVCGQPGPISLHPPTICFAAAGAVQETAVTSHYFTYGDSTLRYFTTDFASESQGQTTQTRVLWSWKGTGPWLAPTVPRWTFGSEPVLGKLYISRSAFKLAPLEEGQAVDASTGELLKQLLPEIDRAMKILPTCRVVN